MLDACSTVETSEGTGEDLATAEAGIHDRFATFSQQGLRILGVACRDMGDATHIRKEDEAGMTFLGFLAFFDPVKAGIGNTLAHLQRLGVSLKIITTNLLADLPEMTIATDRVDPELVERPRRWDSRPIRRFMLTFGPVSLVFDNLTFGGPLFVLQANTEQFRTPWFLESVVSASLIVLVIRSQRPFFQSRPGIYLPLATLLTIAIALMFPFTPLGEIFEFTPLPPSFFIVMGLIVGLYVLAADMMKRIFYRSTKLCSPRPF